VRGTTSLPPDGAPTTVVATRDPVDPGEPGPGPRRSGASAWRNLTPDARFWLGILLAVGLGAALRFIYLFTAAPTTVYGDGLDYHLSALRLADGHGYTWALQDLGLDSGPTNEAAHHPPGWVTVLGAVTELGGRSQRAHQVTGLIIGLAVIAVAGLVGRRYAGKRVGVIAAMGAAVYPGFWVLDVQVLSEPLGLLVLGLLMLVLADLWDRPTIWRAVATGVLLGALALVRAEQLALLALVAAPVLLLNRRVPVRQRLAFLGAATLSTLVVIAPWTIHNLSRFEEPVLLSTNLGSTLLAGNCPPSTFTGEMAGSYDLQCVLETSLRRPDLDPSQVDGVNRDIALDHVRDNLGQVPGTLLARYGRLLGVFRPSQTVGIDTEWLNSARWPVWAWITSFWIVAPLAAFGSAALRRRRRFQWPLVAPVVIVLLVTAIAFGDPRYHTSADLGLVVLAAVAVECVVRRTVEPRIRASTAAAGDTP
jgi:4-amino-4-deoxy-L-arabinose transferase-like glycosyltransferase